MDMYKEGENKLFWLVNLCFIVKMLVFILVSIIFLRLFEVYEKIVIILNCREKIFFYQIEIKFIEILLL